MARSSLFQRIIVGVILVMTVSFAVSASAMAFAPGVTGMPVEQQTPTNATGRSTNASNATASVVLANQTTNGTTVTIKRATLPEGGFLVLSADRYREIVSLPTSMIAVSDYLKPGTYRNITLRVQHSPPGGQRNQTALNVTSDYSVGVYRDTNNNKEFDYITSNGNADTPYIVGEGSERHYAADFALITIPGSRTPTPTASIRFLNQSTNGSTVTIESVTLPDGGFVVVHNESYLHGGDPLKTAIGLSQYLSPGTHHNVTVKLLNGSVQHTQTLVAIPSRDTNDNKRYDYVRSEGFRDVPYTAHGQVITDRATVTVPGSTSTPESPSSTAAPTTTTPSSARTETPQPVTGAAGSGGSKESSWILENILLIGIVVVVSFLVIRLRS